ncbi:MAG: type II toxin-antitoxin system RelB/DinJ family antitoxin [Methylotenera sp.]|nr:type II toxin-antitoxin system RelB/DinJ family antitoxin [Methylotenera sp.]
MMATTSMVHVRVDENIKLEATETLALMGLSVSDAVRVFLTRVVVEKQLPFTLKVPNPETHAAMIEADAIAHRHKARFATADELFYDLEKNSIK